MKRAEAIEIIEKLQEPIETTEPLEGTGLRYPVRIPPEEVYLGEQEHEALELARFNLKQVEEVVGKIDEEIDRIDKTGIVISNRYEALKCIRKMLTEEE